ncbi:MAG TPA: primosomal protein N' [Gemmataceae bacterium]|nr:primosomal protein N' [Gemmataceae bacterium]
MTQTMQRDLFTPEAAAAGQTTGLFADIVFDRPLDHAFTYAVGEELRERIAVGKRVRAPFGRGDKATIGYCVRLSETPPERRVKELVGVLDEEALLTDNLLRLTRWMADYYLCGWGQVLGAVVPAGARDKAGTRTLTFVEAIAEAELPPPHPNPSPPSTGERGFPKTPLSPVLGGEGQGVRGGELTAKQAAVLELLRKAGKAIELRQLTRQAKCGPGPVEALVLKGLARRVARRIDQFVDSTHEEATPAGPLTLSEDQVGAWNTLEPALKQGGFHAFLLHGVTGSGKTEIYLRAIEEVMRQGKETLVMVPEISLTPQTIQRFRGRCGEVAVLHSHLGNAERGGHWRRVAAGHAHVIVGARSAVFAPAKKLGLIVIDEEHENTFKQETTPRYHGRDVAVMRARLENIPIILGSATPSLESWHNAQRGQYTLLTLPQRVLERPMPQVGLIDLRHQPPRKGRPSAISDGLEHAMRTALKGGGQVMLLLNRRGFSTHVHCPSCGHVESCRFCDLALTYHKERDIMLCHYCGYEQEPQRNCPLCGQSAVRYHGLGTEKLQVEIEERFPGYVVRRMDSDTMRKPGSHARVLSAFRRGLIHILLGTQMIAKGLDFPNVTLVGVVNADLGLHVPDFRSAERTFQLLSQVAGRTGRGAAGGRVLVQTFTPEHPCIALAATHDYAGFVAAEMAHRRAHNYPPYQRLARIIVRSRDQQAASAFADQLADAFQRTLQTLAAPSEVRMLGPAEAPVFRLKGYYRFHFQLQSPSPGVLHQVLRAVLPAQRTPAGVEFTLDIDPFNML